MTDDQAPDEQVDAEPPIVPPVLEETEDDASAGDVTPATDGAVDDDAEGAP